MWGGEAYNRHLLNNGNFVLIQRKMTDPKENKTSSYKILNGKRLFRIFL